MTCKSSILYLLLSALTVYASSIDPVWNGFTLPGSRTRTRFTPFYVPSGAKSYDSTSPFVSYKGKWSDKFSSSYVGKSARFTSQRGAQAQLTFTGTGIEWFGGSDKNHGLAIVYIDGTSIQEVDTYHKTSLRQQRLFSKYDLPDGTHTLKIYNVGKRPTSKKATTIDIDAFVVYRTTPRVDLVSNATLPVFHGSALFAEVNSPQWTLQQQGTTGVHAMQLAVISATHALIVDKVEHNPLTIDGHPAWAALYDLRDHSVTALEMESNSFCAGGSFLSNGTLINVGGNPVVESYTSSADFGDLDGLQAIRIFEPCDSAEVGDCQFVEDHSRLRMASPRWYSSVIRIHDGSAMIIGGSKKGGWINNATVNNPTVEFFPPKNIQGFNGLPVHLDFLVRTLYSNLFPMAFSLPDGTVLIVANNDAIIYDWNQGIETILPQIPNGVRVTYPMTATGVLLPLSPDNNYLAEVLLCGGSTLDDTKPGYELSSQDQATSQCSRLSVTAEGIATGWVVEEMPTPRIMPDAVLLPTGDVVIVNGGKTGIAGYGNVIGQVGASNADNPVLTPVLYRPWAAATERFTSSGMPTSEIPRLYHSVATLTPSGNIMIAGSNPNLDRSDTNYGTEYRVEWLNPTYMNQQRPKIVSGVRGIEFGTTFQVTAEFFDMGRTDIHIKVALMDLGYVTHAVHANARLVYLRTTNNGGVLTIEAPPNGNIYPPGPGWIYVLINDIPSEGQKIMVGDGDSPPVDEGALQNLLANSAVNQYEEDKTEESQDGSE